jgi:hypothetical protein
MAYVKGVAFARRAATPATKNSGIASAAILIYRSIQITKFFQTIKNGPAS